jgi:hypothetical protein
MEDCVLNGKSMWSSLPRSEIFNTSESYNDVTWDGSRFYLSSGEVLQFVQDPWGPADPVLVDCLVKNLSDACSTLNLAPGATASASSQESGYEPAKAIDGNATTGWKATSSTDQWLQLDFAQPITINEFKINEDASSSINRYKIEYWDDEESRWLSCFNGYADATRPIGTAFIAPIVSRTTRKVRLTIMKTTSGNPRINEFAVYNDTLDTPAAPTVTWQNQGPNSGDTQKVTVSGAYPSGATKLKFFLHADGTTYTYGPFAETLHQFSNVGDSQIVHGYVQAYNDAGNYSADSAETPCTIGDRTPPDTPESPTVTWEDQGPNSGDTQKVTVSGAYPIEATRLKFYLNADGTMYTYGPAAATSYQFSNVGDSQTVYGSVRAYDAAWNYSAISAKTPCTIGDRTSIPATVSIPSPSNTIRAEQGSGDSPRLVETAPLLGSRSADLKVLSLKFDRAVQIGANVAEVHGYSTGAHQGYACRYDGATNTLYLEWPKALPPDIYDVRILADAVLGADGGTQLDGEIGDPADPDCLPSGDGTPGGDAWLEFEILR